MILAKGETRRKREAVESLVADIVRGGAEADSTEGVFSSIRIALERGWTDTFKEMLVDAERKKSTEIDRICARNYEGFIESVEEILQMRGSAGKLTSLVTQIHTDVASNGDDLIKILKELDKLQRERIETKRALDAATQCRDILTLVVHAKQQIHADDHYGALKTIEKIQAEKTHVQSRNFATSLNTWLGELTNSLVSAAQKEVDAWQNQVKSKCPLLGQTIMRNCMHTRADYKEALTNKSSISVQMIIKHSSVFRIMYWGNNSLFNAYIPEDFHNSATVDGLKLIDSISNQFSSLHKAFYINSIIGDVKTFKIRSNDTKQRIVKSFIDVCEKMIDEKGVLLAYPELIAKITGFFIAECIARQVVEYDEDESSLWLELHQLWERSCSDIIRLCSHKSSAFTTLAQLHIVKEQLLLMLDTLADETFATRPDPVFNIMTSLLSRFKQLAHNQMVTVVKAALNSASNQPLFVETVGAYDSMIRAFRLHSIEDSAGVVDSDRPLSMRHVASKLDALEADLDLKTINDTRDKAFTGQTYPFSQTVPTVLRGLYDITAQVFMFCYRNDGLPQRGELVIKIILDALLVVSKEMQKDLSEAGALTPLAKSCQISIDASSLSQACITLLKRVIADALAQFQWTDSVDLHISSASKRVQKEFMNVANLGLDMIFESLNLKVEELLSSLSYEKWEPQSYPTGPHEAVDSMVDFLQITFMWLTHLPQSAREAAHFTSCSRISSFILEYILSSKVPKLNILALVAIKNDVARLTTFAESTGVPQLKQCFAELEDLSNALLHQDLLQFGENPRLMQSLFPRLDPLKLATVLSKLMPTPVLASGSGRELPRLDKKIVANLLKQLKNSA